MKLKLDKLPDRDPVKITFTASPQLRAALDDYAEIYRREYGGKKEPVSELMPYMLDAFMNADSGFKRARKELEDLRASSSAPTPTPAKPASVQLKRGGPTDG